MGNNLVIVESPAKARTLDKILGRNYRLKASLGHVRDLPKGKLGVDVDHDFAPSYVVPKAKAKLISELKHAVKEASAVYLATDPDREGEAIAWHLAEVTGADKIPYYRVTFHEITEQAVKDAFKHPRDIDMNLVNAQQARRVLDRLVGYKISPLLWQKVRRGLSAGRVQSVAVSIIVNREREILDFVPAEYWTIEADLAKKPRGAAFRAGLVGQADGTKLEIHNQAEADGLKEALGKAKYAVAKVGTKEVSRQPAAPFITSTLQQEAWRKLHFTAKQTMAIAQQLYEGLAVGDEGSVGLITYMRTDSTRVSELALAETREYIGSKFGPDFLPAKARSFGKKVKGAQEAHEAIRPTSIHREPALLKPYLNAAQLKLYELIWKRMVASQMASAVFDSTSVDIEAKSPQAGYLLRATSSVNRFPGFMMLYSEGRDETDEEDREKRLPRLAKGDELDLKDILSEQHFTQPPPRYTEATLVKALEQWGIGRPSTYAPILSTIQDRGYVEKVSGSFRPTDLGMLVNDLLSKHFRFIVNVKFTARMESYLDDIASHKMDWVAALKEFYDPFAGTLEKASQQMERVKPPVELTEEPCPQCGRPLAIKAGRFGKFLACSGYPECKFTKSIKVKTGARCPECGGDLVEKVTKKRRTFYGCSNYPKCQFAMNARPLAQPCPQCGGLLTEYRKSWVKCTKCGHKEAKGQG
ncbi:MAG: type I DNA topoisomerase [Chloroflexi bacterium]|nr:type I DNA topoisomerase [Chloroflexota bacterium]